MLERLMRESLNSLSIGHTWIFYLLFLEDYQLLG